MQRGFLAVLMVGLVCAVVGAFVVLRGMAFFGDALAHAILPGLALGYLISGAGRGQLFWWGLLAALVSTLVIGAIGKSTRIRPDTAIGIVYAGMFALGVVLISTVQNYSADLTHLLFGDVLSVSPADLLLTAVAGSLVLLVILLFYKEFLVLSFDPLLAATLRLPARVLEYLLLFLIAMTIMVSLQTVGVILMVAMLVTPGATAYLLTRRLPAMIALAALIATTCGLAGLYLSFYIGLSSGAAIVLLCTLVFVLVWGAKSVQKSVMKGKLV
jgi:ABC-type Mn2+/Zn2+ transport system permease subunit